MMAWLKGFFEKGGNVMDLVPEKDRPATNEKKPFGKYNIHVYNKNIFKNILKILMKVKKNTPYSVFWREDIVCSIHVLFSRRIR